MSADAPRQTPPGAPAQGSLPESSATVRSIYVLRRFAYKLLIMAFVAFLQLAAGRGFMKPFSMMLIISSTFAMLLGRWLQETPSARHFTHFDEGAWFLMLGILLRSEP